MTYFHSLIVTCITLPVAAQNHIIYSLKKIIIVTIEQNLVQPIGWARHNGLNFSCGPSGKCSTPALQSQEWLALTQRHLVVIEYIFDSIDPFTAYVIK